MDSGYLEVQEASSVWAFGDAGGKQWVSGGARGKLWVSGGAEGKQLVSGGAGGRLCVSGGKKSYCDDPFQTVPGSIPGSCIPAFTGTHKCMCS